MNQCLLILVCVMSIPTAFLMLLEDSRKVLLAPALTPRCIPRSRLPSMILPPQRQTKPRCTSASSGPRRKRLSRFPLSNAASSSAEKLTLCATCRTSGFKPYRRPTTVLLNSNRGSIKQNKHQLSSSSRKGMISAHRSYHGIRKSVWDPETFAPRQKSGRRHVQRGAPSLGSG